MESKEARMERKTGGDWSSRSDGRGQELITGVGADGGVWQNYEGVWGKSKVRSQDAEKGELRIWTLNASLRYKNLNH